MSFRTVLVGVLLIVVVAGGGLAWKGWDSLSGFLDQVEAKEDICSTLSDEERMDLLGIETPKKLLNVEGALDPYTCRWATDDTDLVAYVQALSAPADEWWEHVGRAVASAVTTVPPRHAKELRQASAKPTLTATDACRVAKILFERQGAPRGATSAVTSFPVVGSPTGAPAIMVQSCKGGTYSSVIVTAPGLVLDRTLERTAARALRKVEKRIG